MLSVLVENKAGVLTRIAGLFARRGFNIDTLAVGPTEDESVSRMTITLDGASHPIDQVTKQLHKLVNVIKIRDLEPEETIAREMALFKVSADGYSRARDHAARGHLPRRGSSTCPSRTVTIEVTGTADKIEGFEKHGAPVRPGRDGAHRRDRDRARQEPDVALMVVDIGRGAAGALACTRAGGACARGAAGGRPVLASATVELDPASTWRRACSRAGGADER